MYAPYLNRLCGNERWHKVDSTIAIQQRSMLRLSIDICLYSVKQNIDDDRIDIKYATLEQTKRSKNFCRYTTMPFLDTGHTTLYYDISSTNVTDHTPLLPILLVHGFMGTPQNDFSAQLPLLTSYYTLIMPHLHGYGLSSHRTTYTVNYYREDVTDLITLLDALHLETVNVLGFSDGATVSLLLAALHPSRVAALAILGAQATVNARDVKAIRSWLLEKPLSEEWQQELRHLHGDPYWRSLLPLYVEGQEKLVEAGGILLSDEEIATIRCPTLLMHGTRDRIVSVEYAHTLHEHIPHSHLLLFDAGHAAHKRCEAEYNATILRFFQNPRTFSL